MLSIKWFCHHFAENKVLKFSYSRINAHSSARINRRIIFINFIIFCLVQLQKREQELKLQNLSSIFRKVLCTWNQFFICMVQIFLKLIVKNNYLPYFKLEIFLYLPHLHLRVKIAFVEISLLIAFSPE